jgi:hypothetical protein
MGISAFSVGGSKACIIRTLRIWNLSKVFLATFRGSFGTILECECFDDDKGAPIFNLEKPGEGRF